MREFDYKNKVITIPNILSFLRICLIPVIAYYYIVKRAYKTSIGLLFLSGLTDIVDGFIARHFKMISNVGRILDPVADKLTQLVIMFCLCFRYPHITVILVLFIIKELANGIIALLMLKKAKVPYDSRWHGKLNTVCIYFMIMLHFFWVDIPVFISDVSILIPFVMMIVSFVLYTIQNLKIIKRNSNLQEQCI